MAGQQPPAQGKLASGLGRSHGKFQQLGAMLTGSGSLGKSLEGSKSEGSVTASKGHLVSASLMSGLLRNMSEKIWSGSSREANDDDDEPRTSMMRNPMLKLKQRKKTKVFDVGAQVCAACPPYHCDHRRSCLPANHL